MTFEEVKTKIEALKIEGVTLIDKIRLSYAEVSVFVKFSKAKHSAQSALESATKIADVVGMSFCSLVMQEKKEYVANFLYHEPDIPNFVSRIIEEHKELTQKIGKIDAFIESDTFKGLSDTEKDLLCMQAVCMKGYSTFLNARKMFYENKGKDVDTVQSKESIPTLLEGKAPQAHISLIGYGTILNNLLNAFIKTL